MVISSLNHPKDLLCDELVSWKCNGCRSTWVVVNDEGVADICGKEKPFKVTLNSLLN